MDYYFCFEKSESRFSEQPRGKNGRSTDKSARSEYCRRSDFKQDQSRFQKSGKHREKEFEKRGRRFSLRKRPAFHEFKRESGLRYHQTFRLVSDTDVSYFRIRESFFKFRRNRKCRTDMTAAAAARKDKSDAFF